MKVVHISPMYFGDNSVVGGAERYAMEVARAMADKVPTVFVSFGRDRESSRLDHLQVEIYPSRRLQQRTDRPLSIQFLSQVYGADIVHCHNLGSPTTSLALLTARTLGKPRFVTPLGLLPTRMEHRLLRLVGVSGLLCISRYSVQQSWYHAPHHLIFGGVDTRTFRPQLGTKEQKIVCVARLVPLKGINYLIEAVDPDMRLELYGRIYDERFYRHLQGLATGKDVHFYTSASDDDIARAYSSALVSVLPSVYTDMYGRFVAQPELLGLVLLEAMASATAVVGTNVGAIPEYIREGRTGYVVPPNDSGALHDVLRRLYDNPEQACAMGENGHELVRRCYTWEAVARRCLEAYETDA